MEKQQDTYSAAEAIDALLEEDDGALLAAMARYKSSIIELFGRNGVVEILRSAVDAAPHVEYFSRRSRKEIDPNRPEVNLRVDHVKAVAENEVLAARWKNVENIDERDLLALKAAVIHEEVCRAMATTMNEALAPHWEKAKGFFSNLQKERGGDQVKVLKLMLCTLFTVRVGADPSVQAADRLCTLLVFI